MSSSFTIRCRCGEEYHVQPQDAGRRIKCRCGRTIDVPVATPADVAAVTGELRVRRKRRRSRSGSRSSRSSWLEGVRARTARWRRRGSGTSRRVRRLVFGYAVAAVLVTALLWLAGDRWLPGTLVLFGGRWVMLLPALALVPAAVLAAPRALPLLALTIVVVLGPLMGLRLGLGRWRAREGEGLKVRVVTYNVAGGDEVAPHLERALYEWGADVVALQECGAAIASLVERLPDWHHHVADGLCLLSRFPIRDAAPMDRATLAAMNDAGEGGSGHVVRYTLDAPDGPLHLTNLILETARRGLSGYASLDFSRLGGNTLVRTAESRQARRWVDSARAPIVVGDFNMPPESRIYREAWAGLGNAFSDVGTGFGHTRYNGWIRARIDHVLYGDSWHALRARVGPDEGSDHRPLIVDLSRRVPVQ